MTLLFQFPSWLTGFNFLVALFSALIFIGLAILALMWKGRDQVATLQVDRADAAEGLLKLRDIAIIALERKVADLEEELESVTAEHRTLAGISIAKLMEFWARKEAFEALLADTERDNRILKLRKDRDPSDK